MTVEQSISGKRLIFTAPKVAELQTVETPPPGAGQIRCHTLVSMISVGTETICYERNVDPGSHWDNWIKYPFEPGYLSVGEVLDVGEGVTQYKPGDRICSYAPHREYFIDSAETVFRAPEGVAPELAAWFQLNVIAQNGIREVAPVFGETAVVVGLGPLGQLAVRILGLAGMAHLIALDPAEHRCALARGNGPTQVWSEAATPEVVARVKELTGGAGADMVFDITGNPKVFHAAHAMLRKRGRLGMIGDVPKPSAQSMSGAAMEHSIKISFAHGSTPPYRGNAYYRWGKADMNEFFYEMVRQGRIRLEGLVTHRIVPEEAPPCYADLIKNRAAYMGVSIRWK